MQYQETRRTPAEVLAEPVLGSVQTYEQITDRIASIVLTDKIQLGWLVALTIAMSMLGMMGVSLLGLFYWGVGVWGLNNRVDWGFDIINLVWWIGIGHAGTLISAILLIFRQEWRTSINRFAEAMTLFAVACAGIYPTFHTGRPWLDWWLGPVPGVSTGMWPNFRSPLVWDVFAISTYASVSILFWYVGLVPDLATLRDRAKNKYIKVIYGLFALGWRGSAMHWKRYNTAYTILAGLSMPLVFSVHTVISFDFATSQVPGWHVTIFPPYFVAGAVFAGFAMVLTLAIPLRHVYGLQDFITMRHINNMAKIMLATGIFVVYGYFLELFFGWYSGNEYEMALTYNRLFGPYAWSFWALIFCNGVVPQLLWSTRVRSNEVVLFGIANVVSVGMWLERFVIIPVSLTRTFLPASWGWYFPTRWELSLFFGSIGLFLTMFFLFIRVLPMISIFEVRELAHHKMHEH